MARVEWTVYTTIARKDHWCIYCDGWIKKGEPYKSRGSGGNKRFAHVRCRENIIREKVIVDRN